MIINKKINAEDFKEFIINYEKLSNKNKKNFIKNVYCDDINLNILRYQLLQLFNNIYENNNDLTLINLHYKSYSKFDNFRINMEDGINKIKSTIEYFIMINNSKIAASLIKNIFESIINKKLENSAPLYSIYEVDKIYIRCNNYLNSKKIYTEPSDSFRSLNLIIDYLVSNIQDNRYVINEELDYICRFKLLISNYIYEIFHYNMNELNSNCHIDVKNIDNIINACILKLIISLKGNNFLLSRDIDEFITGKDLSITNLYTTLFKNNNLNISKPVIKIFIIFLGDLFDQLMKYKKYIYNRTSLYKNIINSFSLEDIKKFKSNILELRINNTFEDDLIEMVNDSVEPSDKLNIFMKIANSQEKHYPEAPFEEDQDISNEKLDGAIINKILNLPEVKVENFHHILKKRIDCFINEFFKDVDITSDQYIYKVANIILCCYLSEEKKYDGYIEKSNLIENIVNEIIKIIGEVARK